MLTKESKQRKALLALALSAVLFCTACPVKVSQSALDRAAKASATIASRYVETVDLVGDLYKSGALSLAAKDKIADALIEFGEQGVKFNRLLKTYSAQFKDGNVPPNIWSVISTNFDTLSTEFLKVVNLLPGAAGLGNSKAFRAIAVAVVALAQVLASHSVIPESQLRQIETEVNRHGL